MDKQWLEEEILTIQRDVRQTWDEVSEMRQIVKDIPNQFDLCMDKLNEAIRLSDENMKKLQLMINEFKGAVAMSRASLNENKLKLAEPECSHGRCHR